MARNKIFETIFSWMPTIRKIPREPVSITPTMRPWGPEWALPMPGYRDHTIPITADRLREDSRTLLAQMFKHDPDVSAAVASYLTMSDTPLTMWVHDADDQIDPVATAKLQKMVHFLTRQTDFDEGFVFKQNLQTLCQEIRYMLLLRGAVGAELVYDKRLVPQRIQQLDMRTVFWFEHESGVYKPQQRTAGLETFVDLDIPTFFVSYHRRDVTAIYPESDFVSVINTAASRQQIIDDLYRIMQTTGFPRISLKVMEDVLAKNAPIQVRDDANALQSWMRQRLNEVARSFAGIRPDMPFAHFDSVEPSILNEKMSGATLNIDSIIGVLNAQNQAALKTMATVIGRGNGTTGVASVEARIACMNADQLNVGVKQLLDQILTFAIHSYGIQGYVVTNFAPSELRPTTELEPQLALRSARLLKDLSLGLITDEEYTLKMYGRLPNKDAPKLSGTNFPPQGGPSINTDNISPNEGSLDRSMVPQGGSDAARSSAIPTG